MLVGGAEEVGGALAALDAALWAGDGVGDDVVSPARGAAEGGCCGQADGAAVNAALRRHLQIITIYVVGTSDVIRTSRLKLKWYS